MEQRIIDIENGMNACFACIFYKQKKCGAFFRHISNGGCDEVNSSQSDDEITPEQVAVSRNDRCYRASIDPLPFGDDEYKRPIGDKKIKRFLAKCKSVLIRTHDSEAFWTYFGNEISDAVYELIIQLDFEELEDGHDIIDILRMLDIDYDREKKLYPKYTKELVDFYLGEIRHSQKTEDKKKTTNTYNIPHIHSVASRQWFGLEVLTSCVDTICSPSTQNVEKYNIDWEFLDGENKARFIEEVSELSKLDTDKYELAIMYVWDRLSVLYNKNHTLFTQFQKTDSVYIIHYNLQQLVFGYISAVYLHSVSQEPSFCYEIILNKLDTEIYGLTKGELITKAANACGLSKKLMLNYRYSQCKKCLSKSCTGRVGEVDGCIDIVGVEDNPDVLNNADEGRGEKPSLVKGPVIMDIPISGIDEVDALSWYYDDSEQYEKYYMDEAGESFRVKCRNMANDSSRSLEEKKVWIRRVINTLDTLFVYDDEGHQCIKNCCARLLAILECEFYQMAEPICARRVGLEIEAYGIFEELVSNENITESVSTAREKYSWSIINGIGGNIGLYENKACDVCELIMCPFRYHYHFGECPPSEEYESYMSQGTIKQKECGTIDGVKDYHTNIYIPADLKKYLEALHKGGYLTKEYKWISKGHTNYHAGYAAKIIITQVEGATYDKISEIIGVKGLADSASKCLMQNKTSKIEEIRNCFRSAGLRFSCV